MSLFGVLRRAAALGCLAATEAHASGAVAPASEPATGSATAAPAAAPPLLLLQAPTTEEDLRAVPTVPLWDDLDTHDPDASLFASASASLAGGRLAPPRVLVSAHAAVDGLTLALRLAHVTHARLLDPGTLIQVGLADHTCASLPVRLAAAGSRARAVGKGPPSTRINLICVWSWRWVDGYGGCSIQCSLIAPCLSIRIPTAVCVCRRP